MSRHSDRVRPGSDRAGLYDEITGRIVAELEAGRVPWIQSRNRLRGQSGQ